MPSDNITFVDMFDWKKESDIHEQKLLEGIPELRKPALITIKIERDDDQVNKRTFRGVNQERTQP